MPARTEEQVRDQGPGGAGTSGQGGQEPLVAELESLSMLQCSQLIFIKFYILSHKIDCLLFGVGHVRDPVQPPIEIQYDEVEDPLARSVDYSFHDRIIDFVRTETGRIVALMDMAISYAEDEAIGLSFWGRIFLYLFVGRIVIEVSEINRQFDLIREAALQVEMAERDNA